MTEFNRPHFTDDFFKDHDRHAKKFTGFAIAFGCLATIFKLALTGAVLYGIYFLLTNPEAVNQWFKTLTQ